MRKLLLTAAFLAASSVPSAAATLFLQVFDNGVSEGSAVSTTGTAVLRVSTDPAFDIIDISAAGVPFLTGADLTSATLDVTSGAISATHRLTVNVIQTGVSTPGGHVDSTFTVNNLVGLAGPATLSTSVDGSLIESHTFPLGTVRDSVGPLTTAVGPITQDEHSYGISFTHPDQSVQDTIALTSTVIPEPSTWTMLLLGIGGLAFLATKRRNGSFITSTS